MNADNINKWLTLGANLGVLAGIVLVAYEINQSTLTTRAEMVSSHQDRWVAMDLSWQDGEFAAAWAKAIESPEQLTLTEMVQLNGFMWSFIDHIATNRVLWDLGVLDEPLPTHETLITENAGLFFGNEFARAWVAENRAMLNPRTIEIIDEAMQGLTAEENSNFYGRIRARFSQ